MRDSGQCRNAPSTDVLGQLNAALPGWLILVLVAIAFAEGEFGSARFIDVFLGEDADAVKRRLQFCVILLLISVRRNGNGAADAHESFA